MKITSKRYIIQTEESPIKFHASKGELVDEITSAAFYVNEAKADEDCVMYANREDIECKVIPCLVTYEF